MSDYNSGEIQQTNRELQDRYKTAKQKIERAQQVVARTLTAPPHADRDMEAKRLRQALNEVGEAVR